METRKEMPIFVRIDEYKDILDLMGLLKTKIAETRSVMGRLSEIKNEEDATLEQWKTQLDEIERKISYIDKTLFETEPF
ncbi:MAG: hypothetical protein V1837_07375 [Candidatus Woesearchaeota archaeon]